MKLRDFKVAPARLSESLAYQIGFKHGRADRDGNTSTLRAGHPMLNKEADPVKQQEYTKAYFTGYDTGHGG